MKKRNVQNFFIIISGGYDLQMEVIAEIHARKVQV